MSRDTQALPDSTAAPSGAWFIGLDPSSIKAGIAAINDVTGEVRTHEIHIKGREFARRYVDMRIAIRLFLTPFADDGVWACVVERPTTRNSGATLGGAFGVAMEAAASILPGGAVHDLSPQQVDAIAGVKRIPKQRKACTRARALILGYDGLSQDVADAVCCAQAARVLTERSQTGEAA